MRTMAMTREKAGLPSEVFERRLEALDRAFAAGVRRRSRREAQVASLEALADCYRRAFPRHPQM